MGLRGMVGGLTRQKLAFLSLSPSLIALLRLIFWYGAAARRVASTASRFTLSPGRHAQPSLSPINTDGRQKHTCAR